MTESKPSVAVWVSRGVLAGLFFVTLYLTALGPLLGLYVRGPAAWQDAIGRVTFELYSPVLNGLEEDRLPKTVTLPYLYWLDWWVTA